MTGSAVPVPATTSMMVHNGIEYGDMQLICEGYDILKHGLGLNENEIGEIFTKWNTVSSTLSLLRSPAISSSTTTTMEPLSSQDPRLCRTEGYPKVDRYQRSRSWSARNPHR